MGPETYHLVKPVLLKILAFANNAEKRDAFDPVTYAEANIALCHMSLEFRSAVAAVKEHTGQTTPIQFREMITYYGGDLVAVL